MLALSEQPFKSKTTKMKSVRDIIDFMLFQGYKKAIPKEMPATFIGASMMTRDLVVRRRLFQQYASSRKFRVYILIYFINCDMH
jgi:hypothetical protein